MANLATPSMYRLKHIQQVSLLGDRRILRIWLICLMFLSHINLQSQYVLRGKVQNTTGETMPGVKVYVDNTTYGIITDYNGSYYLEFKASQTYPVHFKLLGYNDTIVSITLTEKYTTLDITLSEKSIALDEVEVTSKKENVANMVIKKVQDNRKNLSDQYEYYTCDTYFKTSLSKDSIREDTSSTFAAPVARLSLIESVSKTTFIGPDTYHENILAHHDYSDKIEMTSYSVVDYFMDDNIIPQQSVMTDPYIFFERVQDGDFNLYQSMINLPKVSEYPIASPVGAAAFTNYRFELTNIFYQGTQKIYEIQVIPLFKGMALLEGTLFVLDQYWVVQSFNLNVNSAALTFFKDFNVIQDYEFTDSCWVPVRREFSYTIKDADQLITANTRVIHSNYRFDSLQAVGEMKTELATYADDAFSRDSSFWEASRPIQLKPEELEFIAEQNRIDSMKQSEHYLDSLDEAFNKVTFFDVVLYGMGFRNRFKQQEIYIAPLLNIEPLGVGGFRYQAGGSYSKKFKSSKKIKLAPTLNYGFNTQDLKFAFEGEYLFQPKRFAQFEVSGGDMYERLTNQLSAVNYLFGGSSSVRNQYFSVAYRQELVNGLYGRVKFSFSNRQAIDSTMSMGKIMDFLQSIDTVQGIDLFNNPVAFDPYYISLFEMKLQYRFRQQYIIRNNEKLIIGTEYPELELIFKQGIPGLFKSEVSFNYLELKLSDEIKLGNWGKSSWKIIGGSFLYKKDLRLIEYKYFKQSDASYFSNPLNTHQRLATMPSTNSTFIQAFYLHHFNGILFNKLPLLRKTKLLEIAGFSMLVIPEQNLYHYEFFIGVERKFRFRNELFKYGFYYTLAPSTPNDATINQFFKLKIGFDYLNTFTNEWSW